jgi:branched-chain amino acid transport system ATP-binding protein
MNELLRIERLMKSFGNFLAVNDVSLNFERGVLTSLIGPNGAGKTTLINLLTGSLHPNNGKIFFKGKEITHLPTEKRIKEGISRSFQIMTIFPRLTVAQNVLLPALALLGKNRGFWSRADDDHDAMRWAEEILKEVMLWNKKEVLAGELSHGDMRLLEMGIALTPKPELCFLDEPSSGMNPVERAKALELIKRLAAKKETNFIIVEHDMDVVFSISERVIVMNKGEIIADGEPGQIKENKEVREVYLGEEV